VRQIFKAEGLKEITKTNKILLGGISALSVSCLLLSCAVFFKEERWSLVPTHSPGTRIEVSSRGFSEHYLREWADWVMQTLMTVSVDTVDRQLGELRAVSSQSRGLLAFLKAQEDFVRGSRVESVFFPKKFEVESGGVVVRGSFRYWLGTSEKPVNQDKSYRLLYKRGPGGLLLLDQVKEVKKGEET